MPIEIEAPDGSIVEFPDGTPDDVIENAMRQEYGGGGGAASPSVPEVQGRPEMWGTSSEATDFLTGGGSTKLGAAGQALGDATVDWFQGKGFNYSDNYDKNLEQARADKQAYNEAHPWRTGAAKAGAVTLGVGTLPSFGTGAMGAMGTGGIYGGIYGGIQDADSFPERVENAGEGSLIGMGLGLGGYGAGKGLEWMGKKGVNAWRQFSMGADDAARANVAAALDDMGRPAVEQKMQDLGPDAVVADALGRKGGSMGRRASNVSPEAREIVEETMSGRKGGQNVRIVQDIQTKAGIPAGGEKTVEQLLKEVDDQYRPTLDRLYTAARKAGKDMPLDYFDDVMKTPQGVAVLKEAQNAVAAKARLAGTPDDISNLAIVDEMKKIFDSKATSAYASGDKYYGGLWGDFAKNLRMRADAYMNMMDDPIYAEARRVAQEAYRAKDAITLGSKLGKKSIPVDLPGKVQGVDLQNRQRVAQGYASEKTGPLLNRQSTEGAIGEFTTPKGREAANAALGPGALDKPLARERTFNITNRDLVGNSTTTRQLADDGGMGILDLVNKPARTLRDMAGSLIGKISTEKQRQMAPIVAKILMGNELPESLPPALLNKMLNAADEKAAKTLLLTWEREAPKAPANKRLLIERLEEDR
jgi:hypothetical protein